MGRQVYITAEMCGVFYSLFSIVASIPYVDMISQ